MRHSVDPRQNELFDLFESFLSPTAYKRLKTGYHAVFRRVILELMPVDELGEHFHPSMGRPPLMTGRVPGAATIVMEPAFFDYLSEKDPVLELEPMENLARDGQLTAYKHPGFWQPMDTLRDKEYLESLLKTNRAPWQTWQDEESG
jgi:hypothetical protein